MNQMVLFCFFFKCSCFPKISLTLVTRLLPSVSITKGERINYNFTNLGLYCKFNTTPNFGPSKRIFYKLEFFFLMMGRKVVTSDYNLELRRRNKMIENLIQIIKCRFAEFS